MKYIKNFKYIVSTVLLLCLLPGVSSCMDEDFVRGEGAQDYSTVSLKIKLPEQTQVNPMSRAEASDFDVVSDVNIFVCEGDNVAKRIFLDAAGLAGTSLPEGMTVTSKEDTYGYIEYTLNFDNSFWSGISIKDCKFYAVANWGSEITETTLTGVRNLKVDAKITSINNVNHATPGTPNAMYGEESGNPAYIEESGQKIKVITIDLKRTAAMITLQMNGEQLSDKVVIELQSVALRNVPTSCTLGPGNKAANHAAVSSYGDYNGGPAVSGGYKLIGAGRYNSSTGYDEANGYKTIIGGHYPKKVITNEDGTNSSIVSDVTGAVVVPFFMFENMQGTGEAVTSENQAYKRPSGWPDNKTEIGNRNDSEDGKYSYLEVIADYTEYDDNGEIAQRGTATWRFFLGKNPYDNFDVERNTNYRITLTLKDTGILERDYSWRVDAPLKKPDVVGNENNVVGGGGEMFCVEFTSNAQANMKVLYETDYPGKDFVYAYMSKSGGGQETKYSWQGASVPASSAYFWWLTAGKQLWFYVSPLMPGDDNVTERTCKITFQTPSGSITFGTVSFTQYMPVTFSVKQSDLTEYPDDEDLLGAVRILKNYYNHDVATQGDFEFWADRIDRDAMPWGFTGIQMDKNQNTGFENVYHLIKPLEDNIKETCNAHIAYAGHYLPTGKGYREEKPNTNPVQYEDYIDYSRGSCMVHAAMENHFQQYYPYPGGTRPDNTKAPNATPAQLLGVTLDKVYRPGTKQDPTPEDRRFSWCVPSIAGCQLVEKLDRFYKRHNIDRGFDPAHPIVPWVSYWTSNSATADLESTYPELDITGKNRSFVYRFDTGLDKIKEDEKYPARLVMPRASSIRYRLLNIRPSSSGTTTN